MPLTPIAHSLDLQPFLGPSLGTKITALTWYALIWISLGWLLQILTRMVKATLQHQWHGHHTRYNFPFTNLELCLRTSACLKQQVIQKRRSKWHCWKPKRTVVITHTKKIQAVKKRQWLVTKQCIKDISRSFSAIWFMPWACTEFTRQNHSGDNRAPWRLLSVTHEPLLSYTKRKKKKKTRSGLQNMYKWETL